MAFKVSKASKMVLTVDSAAASAEEKCCSICAENYTAVLRRRCECKYCKKSTCSKCIESYLLTRHDDAHCVHCRVHYNDKDLQEICTKTYLVDRYFKHRQEVLINRERANLPGLQHEAHRQRLHRDRDIRMIQLNAEIKEMVQIRNAIRAEYVVLKIAIHQTKETTAKLVELEKELEAYLNTINIKKDELFLVRTTDVRGEVVEEKKEEERKKFIRRCTRSDCNGFLSTAWKCGLCDWYSCKDCFTPKGKEHDVAHECKPDDLKTAELICKDSKPCPNCGEFINKSSGCSQMWCITCHTPFDWNTGKIVTSGAIHNPHYYEMMKRKGALPRNPGDVPCGGFPTRWQLVEHPAHIRASISDYFYEFHRLCEEVQDTARRTFRAHVDNGTTHSINIRFLLGDFTEPKWGQQLAMNEKKRKRDAEVQEVFAAFLMVAVNIINTVQNYRDPAYTAFRHIPVVQAERLLMDLHIEITELITIMNDAFKGISIAYAYTVPFIDTSMCNPEKDTTVYRLIMKNFKEAKRAKPIPSDSDDE
jgi:hypothetical protein